MDTKLIGDISELKVAIYAIEKGILVSKPIGDRYRYDQIWDYNGKLLKIQIKSPHEKNGVIEVLCKSTTRKNKEHIPHIYTKDEIDAIVVPYNNECYILPIQEASNSSICLRYDYPKNNNQKNIKWLKDYHFDKIIDKL